MKKERERDRKNEGKKCTKDERKNKGGKTGKKRWKKG